MSHVQIRYLGCVAVGLPLFGFIFVIIWSMIFHYEESVRTICHVPNFLPSVSSAIGGFLPQGYIWRICITLQAGLRFLLAFCYYNWHLRVHLGTKHGLYQKFVWVAIFCHVTENLALVTLTCVSSTDNADIHEYSFIIFMVCSLVYMLLSCCIIKWAHTSGSIKVTEQDQKNLHRKMALFSFNIGAFLFSIYFYFQHNNHCEPYVYSWFAFCEYLTILSNIAFHGMCCWDFKHYSFTVLNTEDIKIGRFKNN